MVVMAACLLVDEPRTESAPLSMPATAALTAWMIQQLGDDAVRSFWVDEWEIDLCLAVGISGDDSAAKLGLKPRAFVDGATGWGGIVHGRLVSLFATRGRPGCTPPAAKGDDGAAGASPAGDGPADAASTKPGEAA